MMHFIIAAILNAIAGQLDEFAARVCKGQQFEISIFYGDLDEIVQALTPASTPGDLPGVDVLDQVEQFLDTVMA